jgi:hypothetical protein
VSLGVVAGYELLPSAPLRVRFGKLHVGAGLLAAIFLLDGAENAHGALAVRPASPSRCTDANLDSVDCPRATRPIAGERSYGRFTAFVPNVALGYTF